MLKDSRGFSGYIVISIIAFLALVFILIIPQVFNVKEQELQKQRYTQMLEIKSAVEKYMADRNQSFSGDLIELVRTGYLRYAYESPFNGNGDKYIARGDYNTGDVTIKDPNEIEHPIPEKYQL